MLCHWIENMIMSGSPGLSLMSTETNSYWKGQDSPRRNVYYEVFSVEPFKLMHATVPTELSAISPAGSGTSAVLKSRKGVPIRNNRSISSSVLPAQSGMQDQVKKRHT